MFSFLKKKYQDVTSQDVQQMMNKSDSMVVDVREDYEYERGHIPNSKWIALGTLQNRIHEIDKNKKIIVVCASGGRSARASSFLSDAGFDVYNMQGGMMAWAGPVNKGMKK